MDNNLERHNLEDHQFSAVYELPNIENVVDYFENNDIKTKESKKI